MTLNSKLLNAAGANDFQKVKELVSKGADVNSKDEQWFTPLHNACGDFRPNIALIKFLIDKGADIKADSKYNGTPLHWACYTGNLDVVKLLTEKGGNINLQDSYRGNTPLHDAAGAPEVNLKLVKYLISLGADVEIKNKHGKTPFEAAKNIRVKQILSSESVGDAKTFHKKSAIADEIIAKLDDLGYYKFVPRKQKEEAKSKTKEHILNGIVSSTFDSGEIESTSFDKRVYRADSEDLAEQGIGSVIGEMKTILEKEGVIIKNIDDVATENGKYSVKVNNKVYEVFNKENDDESDDWSIALEALVDIVNELLENAGSKERLYSIYGGNDSQVIFLTKEMHNLLYEHSSIFRSDWLP